MSPATTTDDHQNSHGLRKTELALRFYVLAKIAPLKSTTGTHFLTLTPYLLIDNKNVAPGASLEREGRGGACHICTSLITKIIIEARHVAQYTHRTHPGFPLYAFLLAWPLTI